MPCIIILEEKNTSQVKQFAGEAGRILDLKGYKLISQHPVTYFNSKQIVSPNEVSSTIKMLKAITTYSQVVKRILYSNTLKVSWDIRGGVYLNGNE